MSQKKRHPLRKLLILAVLAGIAVAIKNALEDKGGSYDAPADAAPANASVPTPPVPTSPVVTAEDILDQRIVENLDEFADPAPESEPSAEDEAETTERPHRTEPEVAAAIADAEEREEMRDVPGKIDPFGLR